MWSNFTDFALKAQKDLQEQANEAASKLQQQLPPISVCGLYNPSNPLLVSFHFVAYLLFYIFFQNVKM